MTEELQDGSVVACEWAYDEDSGAHDTECGKAFMLNDGTLIENGFVFCPFCGQKIQETAQ